MTEPNPDIPPSFTDLESPELYINRELSWLEFNHRVLEEAQDPTHPLLERVKFLCIVSSNLDEFFEIRVAGIKQQIENKTSDIGPDGLSSLQIFQGIRQRTLKLVEDQYRTWNEELLPTLAKQGIHFFNMEHLEEKAYEWLKNFFHNEIFPVLTPLAIDPAHPFPQLLNKSLNIIVMMEKTENQSGLRYAVVQVPRALSRLVEFPANVTDQHHFVFLSRLITHFIGTLFPGSHVLGAWAFRVTRNSDLYIDDEEAQNLLSSIEEELRNRNKGAAVRLEVEHHCPGEVVDYLLKVFNLSQDDLYLANGSVNLLRLMPICELEFNPKLKDTPFTPYNALPFTTGRNPFHAILNQDILLHHPYESFSAISELLDYAAEDPKVLAIKMTLYRTSGDSPVVKALIRAARKGKQVTVLVELRARFDEANNIAWARRMEDAGIHVVYGLVGYKTHCKTLLIVRRDDDRIRHYAHLGTGNYHSKTARFYTDLGLLTVNPDIANEVAVLFNTLTGMSDYPGFDKLLIAPFDLANKSVDMIHAEAEACKQGKPARIFAKMNSLVDPKIIKALYEASQAGVKIDLLIRGICCLRPGVPGVSENIRVLSIVDRFLEHSRIFYYENGGDPKIYAGSADWMPRNLYRRIEAVFPVEDPALKQRIKEDIIDIYLKDNVKVRLLNSDGTYNRIQVKEGQPRLRSQSFFIDKAKEDNDIPPTKLSHSQRLNLMPPPKDIDES